MSKSTAPAAIAAPAQTESTAPAAMAAPAVNTGKKAVAKTHYQEWRMERNPKTGEMEKLKMLRPCVKISEAEAETLNGQSQSPSATNPIMYLKPEPDA